MPLTTVVFDADETLLDLRPAVTGALVAVLEEMRRLTPAAVAVSLADLEADWHHVFSAMATEPIADVRRAALARSLARVGLADELERIAEFYFARRFALTRPFPDAVPALAALRRHLNLGLATNGNSLAERCRLGGEFTFEVYAHVGGVPKKPDPAFYAVVLAAAGVSPTEVLYVGDSLAHDVVAAQAAGLRAVWLNRTRRPCPDGVRPDAQVHSLAELPEVVRRLNSDS